MPLPMLSYWESTTFLRPADVVVIGAGLTGLQAALAIKRREPQRDVLVVERGPIPHGASTRNGGFACFGSPTELLADLDAYGVESMLETVRQRYAGVFALEKNFAQRSIGWDKTGGYEVVDAPETEAMLRERLPALNALLAGVTGEPATWREVPGEGTHRLTLFNPCEAQLHPGLLVTRLLEDAQREGVRLLFGAEVTQLGAAAGAVDVELAGLGTLRAGQALIAVNAFARKLLPDDFPERIRPVRNQVLLSRPLEDFHLRGCYHYHEGYVYFRNVGPDRLLIGGARHVTGPDSETEEFGYNPVPVAFLLEKLRQWYPERRWEEADFPVRWSGILAQGESKTPILRFAEEGVLVAGRLAGMGVALSADLARRAADLLLR